MRRSLFLLAILGILLGCGGDLAAAKKKAKAKGIPPAYKDLNLTNDQVKQLQEIRQQHAPKIKELTEQLQTERAKERAEMEKVLTDDQKAQLQELKTKPKKPGKKPAPEAVPDIKPGTETKPADKPLDKPKGAPEKP